MSNSRENLKDFMPFEQRGRIRNVVGLVIEAQGLTAPVGALCRVVSKQGESKGEAEVVGFRDSKLLLLSLDTQKGIEINDEVQLVTRVQSVTVGTELQGRVLDARGRPIDGKGELKSSKRWPLYGKAAHPLNRPRIKEVMSTGVRAIDGLLTCGRGQRLGLFAGSGVGKSVLLGMMARFCEAEVIVIGLIGERGREVREFLERDLGPEGLKRSVVVVATGDEPPCLRVKGAFTATAIAEYYREQGKDVMLLIDSVSRVAYAQREIGLSTGEPPATRGYPPSVFSLMPQLMERSGLSEKGSMTAFYTVLVEGDDLNEPVSDVARATLDGHISLSRRLANQGHYPAISVLESISRVMTEVVSREHQETALKMRDLLAAYEDSEDLINIGAYVQGSNPRIDEALYHRPKMLEFLKQFQEDKASFESTCQQMVESIQMPEEDPAVAAQGRVTDEVLEV
jgi:flagellum-specific ATP synthase